MKKVSIIGTGNVAHHLAKAILGVSHWKLHQIYGRDSSNLTKLQQQTHQDFKSITTLDALEDVDVILCCVSDQAISEIAHQLKHTKAVLAHTSGATPLLKETEHNAVFYPLQSFSKLKALNYADIPFCLEADTAKGLNILSDLANSISTEVYRINTTQRLQLHLAAVFVNNFTNYMVKIGEKICDEHQVNSAILKPLIKETFDKLNHLSAKEAQTGPAKRQDVETIHRHLQQLTNSNYKSVYQTISTTILNDYGKEL